MSRPARALAVSGAVVVGVLVGGTTYAASRAQSPDETHAACVDLATDVTRSTAPPAGTGCPPAAGPGQVRPEDVAAVRMADYILTTTANATPAPATPPHPTRPAETTRPPAPGAPENPPQAAN